jgi:hypothetical protein
MSQSNEATTPVLIVESVNNKRKYTKKVNEPIIQDAVTDAAVEKKPRVKKTKVTDAVDDDVDESEGPIKSRGKKTKVTDADVDEVSAKSTAKSNKKTKVVELVVGEISRGEVEVEVSEKPKRAKKSKKNVEVV